MRGSMTRGSVRARPTPNVPDLGETEAEEIVIAIRNPLAPPAAEAEPLIKDEEPSSQRSRSISQP